MHAYLEPRLGVDLEWWILCYVDGCGLWRVVLWRFHGDCVEEYGASKKVHVGEGEGSPVVKIVL